MLLPGAGYGTTFERRIYEVRVADFARLCRWFFVRFGFRILPGLNVKKVCGSCLLDWVATGAKNGGPMSL